MAATLRQRHALAQDPLFLAKVREAIVYQAKYMREVEIATPATYPPLQIKLAYLVVSDSAGYTQRFADVAAADATLNVLDVEHSTFDAVLQNTIGAVWPTLAPLA